MSARRVCLVFFASLFLNSAWAWASDGPESNSGSDKLLVAKFLYDGPPARLDVVVFKYPPAPDASIPDNYLKRLVGLPGETVVIHKSVMATEAHTAVERITIEGGKVEIHSDTIKIEGGKVEIIRPSRR
jgi:hypothetical protein